MSIEQNRKTVETMWRALSARAAAVFLESWKYSRKVAPWGALENEESRGAQGPPGGLLGDSLGHFMSLFAYVLPPFDIFYCLFSAY